jgi:Leucine-rich repeat (LRR) protein
MATAVAGTVAGGAEAPGLDGSEDDKAGRTLLPPPTGTSDDDGQQADHASEGGGYYSGMPYSFLGPDDEIDDEEDEEQAGGGIEEAKAEKETEIAVKTGRRAAAAVAVAENRRHYRKRGMACHMSTMQKIGIGLVVGGLVLAAATVIIVLVCSGDDWCRRQEAVSTRASPSTNMTNTTTTPTPTTPAIPTTPATTPTTTTTPTTVMTTLPTVMTHTTTPTPPTPPAPTTASPPISSFPPPVNQSTRAQSIVEYINRITLTGRMLVYPNITDTTPEGLALAWLIEDDKARNNVDDTPVVASLDDDDERSLRQRYALASLWLPIPFPSPLGGTWGTPLHECKWNNVICGCELPSSNTRLCDAATARTVVALQLKDIGVHGRIPDDLSLLTELITIDLTSNALEGTIPPSWGDQLTLLRRLNLRDNHLTGTIPSSLGALTGLTALALSSNKLNGTIPSSLGALTSLRRLNLQHNELTGLIPSSLTALPALSALYLNNNQINGTMPFCQNRARPSLLQYLVADCDKVFCPCCTQCCPTGRGGIPGYESCNA